MIPVSLPRHKLLIERVMINAPYRTQRIVFCIYLDFWYHTSQGSYTQEIEQAAALCQQDTGTRYRLR